MDRAEVTQFVEVEMLVEVEVQSLLLWEEISFWSQIQRFLQTVDRVHPITMVREQEVRVVQSVLKLLP